MTTRDEDWPTQPAQPNQPAGTDTMPIEQPNVDQSGVEPPPSGLAAAAGGSDGVDWHDRYESERRRSHIFMAATALAGAGLLASLIFAAAQAQSGGPGSTLPGDPEGFGGPGMSRGHHDFGGDHHDGDFDGFERSDDSRVPDSGVAPDTTIPG